MSRIFPFLLLVGCVGQTNVSNLFVFDYCVGGTEATYRYCYWSENESADEFVSVMLIEDGLGDDFDLQVADPENSIYYLAVQMYDEDGNPLTESAELDDDHEYVECGQTSCTQYAVLPAAGRFYVQLNDSENIVDAIMVTDEE